MKKITEEQLKNVLDSHTKWLTKNDGKRADLTGADLTGADLTSANLKYADLTGADLTGAYLTSANLKYADLTGADLTSANLKYADLTGAYLSDAYLDNVKQNESTCGLEIACPEEGEFVGYKKAHGKIIVLQILSDARRSSATTKKCRCDKAIVLRIEELDGTISSAKQVSSDYNENFVYEVGKEVTEPNFDINRWNECSSGIHFFINKDIAREYNI